MDGVKLWDVEVVDLSIAPNLKVYILNGPRFIINQQLSGAAEARRAHNPEGNGSKPFSAITFVFFGWTRSTRV